MAVYAGPWWSNGAQADGWVEVHDGRIVASGRGTPEGRSESVVILDGLVNYHTHVGDAFLQGQPLPRTLHELVEPGTGLKHRLLASATPPQLAAGIRQALQAYAGNGIVEILDFREQGPPGVRLARAVADEVPAVAVRLLGRPAGMPWSRQELEELLDAADGLGVPSLTDYGMEASDELRLAFRSRGLPFALHVSEARREPMSDVLGLEPDLLIHLCKATRADLALVAREHRPVVVCPTSNAYFGLKPPVADLVDLGIPWYIGTDNAMLGGTDLLGEVRQLRRWAPHVDDEQLLRALTTRPWKAIKRIRRLEPEETTSSRLVVLPWDESRRVRWEARPLILER